jgi:circadian clock protein KaiC
MEERIASGIYGLDELIGGGFRKNAINIIHGGIGVGKTTFGLQFALHGLNHGAKVVFISFEMSEDQIMRDCKQLGFEEIEEHLNSGNMKLVHIYGEDLIFPSLDILDIIHESLSENDHPLIIVDPLTHYSMYMDNDKRKSLSSIFKNLREMGTSVITLEDTAAKDEINNSSIMPLYLADTVLHLDYLGFGELFDRTLRVVKHRGSKHGEGLYPYRIENGLGIVVVSSESDIDKVTPTYEFDKQFLEAIRHAENIDDRLVKRIELLRHNWSHKESPEYILNLVINDENR